MSTQISLKLSKQMHTAAKKYAHKKGYDTLQEFIRELMRQKLFEDEEKLSSLRSYAASEAALAKKWLSVKEDKAWAHLEKEI